MNKFELCECTTRGNRIFKWQATMWEERLINFAVLIIEIVNELPNTKAGNHSRLPHQSEFGGQVSGQLIRSGTSPALNYGEA